MRAMTDEEIKAHIVGHWYALGQTTKVGSWLRCASLGGVLIRGDNSALHEFHADREG